ncbi:hypothetical protein KKA14_12560 [bacterium]|nr:hypothetical protein [bacterium]
MNYELGIDEAGRGPILGPLVMAGVLVPDDKKEVLLDWGVADSKQFGSGVKGKQQREKLAQKIKENFQHEIFVLSSQKVDNYVEKHSLNNLEQETALRIIQRLPADTVILDGKNLFKPIVNEKIKAYNKADQKYLCVSAASILAKAERDRLFDTICLDYIEDFGEIKGGGYANKKTLEFVQWFLGKNGTLPPFYRKSFKWKYLLQIEREYNSDC